MGLTGHTFNLITKYCNMNGSMLELGDQIIYFNPEYGTYSTPYFKNHYPNLDHICIDIKPEKHAKEADLREPLNLGEFDSITNAGTTEHVQGSLWAAYKNIHEACKVGGIMVHENPKTGNWPGHGDHYMTQGFYLDLANKNGYSILDIGEHPAMGNSTDGWNVYCVLRKNEDTEFMTEQMFNQLDFRDK